MPGGLAESGITKGGESLLEGFVLPFDVWVRLRMVRGTQCHLGLQFLPQMLPESRDELGAPVTVDDLG